MGRKTTAERLAELMDYFNIKQNDLCQKTGIPKSAMSMYVNGKRIPRQDRLSDIADAYGVSETWLMGYDVPVNRTNVQSSHKEFNIDDFDSIKSKKLVSSIIINAKKLNDSGKQNLLDYSNILLGNPAFANEPEPYVNAAHMRTDIKLDKNDDDPYDDKIMDDENF